jgi:1,4-dihydroxy-2-naphthoate octaprenyltransferase
MFYLLMALLAPVRETVRVLRKSGSPRQWQLVLRQFLLAAAILASMWLAAWGIGIILAWPSGIGRPGGVQDVAAYPRVIGRSMALFTLTTLSVVLALVEILRLVRRVLERREQRTLVRERRQPAAPRLAAHIARADDAA